MRDSGVRIIVSLLFVLNVIILQYATQLRFSWSTSSNPNHLVVIQHGLNYPSIVNYPTYYFLKNQFISHTKHHDNDDEYMIYLAHSNSAPHLFSFFYHTNNGIIHAASNLADEIYHLVTETKSINKITFIGCSIGGNYIRYTSHLLHSNASYHINGIPFFKAIHPVNLISLAAPHLGIADWIQLPQSWLDFLSKYSPSLTFKELLNIDAHNLLHEMNSTHSVFNLYDQVLLFYNSGWDSLVTCESSALDEDGALCQRTKDHCNDNIENVFTSNYTNATVHRIPVCLRRNWFEQIMAHAILSLSMPPVSNHIVHLIAAT